MPTTLTRSRPHAARAAIATPVIRPTYGPGGRFIDEYDRAVAILTRRPELIEDAWDAGYAFRHDGPRKVLGRSGPLRMFCSRLFSVVPCEVGCLTQIRKYRDGCTETGRLIEADERLPTIPDDITPANLPAFAEWQRRIDRKLAAETR